MSKTKTNNTNGAEKKKPVAPAQPPIPPAPPGIVLPPGATWPISVHCEEEMGRYDHPIPVPLRLNMVQAKEHFDQGWRVFVTAKNYFMEPSDQCDNLRRRYSYTWDDWWQRGVLNSNELVAWNNICSQHNLTPLNPAVKLFDVWEKICRHARKQPHVANPTAPFRYSLDFFVFKEPTVLVRRVKTVKTKKPYIAYYNSMTDTWVYVCVVKKV